MRWIRLGLLLFIGLISPLTALAQADANQKGPIITQFGDGYHLQVTVFNSTQLTPEIAERYGLTRDRNQVLVNVVVRDGDSAKHFGIPVAIDGDAKNLIGQVQTLNFQEIQEREATYYLAPVDVHDEEVLDFRIAVTVPQGPSEQVRFRKRLYSED